MIISLELPDDQAQSLRKAAESLGVMPEELVRAGLSDWLSSTDEDFQRSAERVLRKNKELYERLR